MSDVDALWREVENLRRELDALRAKRVVLTQTALDLQQLTKDLERSAGISEELAARVKAMAEKGTEPETATVNEIE